MNIRECVIGLSACSAALVATAHAEASDACPTVWNMIDRILDAGSGVVLREEKRIGLRSEAEVVTTREALAANAMAAGLDPTVAVRSHLEGPDCNGDEVIDGHEHIYLDDAPVGFTADDWAAARTSRSDPFIGALRGHLARRPE